jgi:hypothetical protein
VARDEIFFELDDPTKRAGDQTPQFAFNEALDSPKRTRRRFVVHEMKSNLLHF